MGVVYAPVTDELYMAVDGFGAYRNGVRITQRTSKKLMDAVVCFEFGYERGEEAVNAMTLAVKNIMKHGCQTMRCTGSGVLDLCYVATGRFDVVYCGVSTEGWKPWDYCAALAICRETGCSVEAIDQKIRGDFNLLSTSMICAVSQSLLEELRNVIKPKTNE
jgi:myo-inositol-1(or 4)-monophosphatase